MDKRYLKITQKGFEHYTGPLSVYEFKDGMSLEPIPRFERDRIAATMSCIEISETGKEGTAGIADRLVSESKSRAPKKETFERQSVDDKVKEERDAAEKSVGDVRTVYTEEQLDEIIEKGGIAGLREIAAPWNVKNRSIPALRQMVLDAQEAYVAKEGSRVEKAKAAVEKVVRDTASANGASEPAQSPQTDDVEQEQNDVNQAAATGDMSAALNQTEPAKKDA